MKYPPEKKWYVLYVKSRSEKKVKSRFDKIQMEAFLPLIKVVRQWSDRRKQVQVPLFGGYIFVHIDPTAFTEVRMVEGVVNFVDQDGKHASVKDENIISVKKFIETGVHIEASSEHFEKGVKVKINFGPMKDCEGELIEIRNEKHFIVRIEVINQVLKVSVPENYLEKI